MNAASVRRVDNAPAAEPASPDSQSRAAPSNLAWGRGFIDTSLATHLTAMGTPVVVLSRGTPRVEGPWRHARWDTRTLDAWKTDPELALYGRYVVSRRLREAGFEYRFPDLGPAIADLL